MEEIEGSGLGKAGVVYISYYMLYIEVILYIGAIHRSYIDSPCTKLRQAFPAFSTTSMLSGVHLRSSGNCTYKDYREKKSLCSKSYVVFDGVF